MSVFWDSITVQDFPFSFMAGKGLDLAVGKLIFTTILDSLVIAALPIFIVCWCQSTVACRSGLLFFVKASTIGVLICLEANLATSRSESPSTQLITEALQVPSTAFVSSLCLAPILYLEHHYSFQSTAFVSLWLVATIVRNVVDVYLGSCQDSLHDTRILQLLVALVKAVLFLLEETSKYSLLVDRYLQQHVGPESSTGFFSRSFFLWLNKVFALGFKNILSAEQLNRLGPEFSVQPLLEHFGQYWKSPNGNGPNSLLLAAFNSLKSQFLWIAFPRLFHSIFKVLQVALIYGVIHFLEGEESSQFAKMRLMFTAFFIYSCLALSRGKYEHANYSLGVQLSTILNGEVYRKSLRLKQPEAKRVTALAIVSTDITNLVHWVRYFHSFWASSLEICLCIAIIIAMAKKTAILILVPAAITVATSMIAGKHLPQALQAWSKSTEARVARASSMVTQARNLKMIGLEAVAGDHMQQARKTEMEFSKASRKWVAIIMTVNGFRDCITPTLMIGATLFWSKLETGLSIRNVYTMLAILTLAMGPLMEVLDSYSFVLAFVKTLNRVQDYLELEEQTDCRQTVIEEAGVNPINEQATEATEDTPHREEQNARSVRPVIRLVDSTVGYDTANPAVLRNVSLSVYRHQICMVVGATASGKSTLIKTLLGETDRLSGSIYVEPGPSGFCDQTPWLQNKSVRDNIIGESPVNEEWYGSVIRACLLQRDLQRLEKSGDTIVGSNGAMLSGGQRHRIALARAVYSRSPYLFLDNVFASLDDNTASTIFSRLFGEDGLLKQCPMTVVMTTCSMKFLMTADWIVLIKRNGRVTTRPNLDDAQFRARVRRIISQNRSVNTQTNAAAAAAAAAAIAPTFGKAGTDDDPVPRTQNLGTYRFYLGTFKMAFLLLWIVMAILNSITENFPDAYITIWLQNDPDNKDHFTGYAAISLSTGLFGFLFTGGWFLKLVPDSSLVLHQRLVNTLMGATLPALTSMSHGLLLGLFCQDMTLVTKALPFSQLRTLFYFLKLSMRFSMILTAVPMAKNYITGLAMVLLLIQLYYMRTSRQISRLSRESKVPLNTQFTESGHGVQHIRALNWQSQYTDKAFEAIDSSQKLLYYTFAIEGWLVVVTDTMTSLIGLGILAIVLFGELSVPVSGIALSMVCLVSLSDNLMQFLKHWAMLEESISSLTRVKDFIATTPQEVDPKDQIILPESWPQEGKVVLKNVTARHNPKSTVPPALNGIWLTMPAGYKVGIVGRTGCGKSTLLMTILKFLQYSGQILVDDVDIAHVPYRVLRSKITTVSQDNIEFDESVRFNLCPWTMNVSRDEGNVIEAAVESILDHLGLWELVQSFGGLDTKMSVLGLSEGQKQLMSIARACLHKLSTSSRLVFMDEPTSSLDNASEQAAQSVMDIAFWDCTVVVVAHRDEAVADANMIVYMEDGKVVRKTYPNPKVPEPGAPTT